MSVFSESAIQFSIRWPLRRQEAVEIVQHMNQLRQAIYELSESSKAWKLVFDAIADGYFCWEDIRDHASYVRTLSMQRKQSVAEEYKVTWEAELADFHKHFCSQCCTAQEINTTDNASHQAIRGQNAPANAVEALAWALECIEKGLPDSPAPSKTTREEAKNLKDKLEEHIAIVWHVPFDEDPLINEPTILPSDCSSQGVSRTPSPTFSIPTTGNGNGTTP
jgi:hypothetical protein